MAKLLKSIPLSNTYISRADITNRNIFLKCVTKIRIRN